MKAPVLLVHGRGFDAAIWDAVATLLPDRALFRAEAGYLGAEPRWPSVPRGTVAVGHSAGVLSLLRRWPEGCAGLVSIAGFTRFAAAPGFPGVPGRVLARMARQLDADPRATLDAFRARCGGGAASAIVPERLAEGLRALRADDGREAAAELFGVAPDGTAGRPVFAEHHGDDRDAARRDDRPSFGAPDAGLCALSGIPLLAFASADDPIVDAAHGRACFAPGALRWSDGGGHLLPLTRPAQCAAMIRSIGA